MLLRPVGLMLSLMVGTAAVVTLSYAFSGPIAGAVIIVGGFFVGALLATVFTS